MADSSNQLESLNRQDASGNLARAIAIHEVAVNTNVSNTETTADGVDVPDEEGSSFWAKLKGPKLALAIGGGVGMIAIIVVVIFLVVKK